MESLHINIMSVVVIVAVFCKMADGYRKGMVKEIISLVSMVVLCLVAALAANGIHNYIEGKFLNVAAAVLLLSLLGIAHHLLSLVFFSAKLVAKLPVIHSVDKLLGIVFGGIEVILILWTVYAFIMIMDVGAAGGVILSYTEESPMLLWIYRHNYLARWIERFLDEFSFIPIQELQKLLDGVAESFSRNSSAFG